VDIRAQSGDGVSRPTLNAADAGAMGAIGAIGGGTHPRLFFRASDVTRLRSWATASNPIYESGLKQLAEMAIPHADDGSAERDDTGSPNGYVGYPSESLAMMFGFMSHVAPSVAERAAYGKRAKRFLMRAIHEAALGAAEGKPFRDPYFAIGDRSRWSGAAFPLAVDWIYDSLDAGEKKEIRAVFLRWATELRTAETTTFNHPAPVGILNDPRLTNDVKRVRWAGNNYYTAHLRNLTLMSLAFDSADDPGGKLHEELASATGAWLYVSDALMRGDMRGGLAAEGFEYSPQAVGYVAQALLAIFTANEADPRAYGTQSQFSNPFWNEVIPGYLHSLSPVARAPKDPDYAYMGPLYDVAWYGDGQKYWAPDFMGVFGPLGLYAQYTGNEARLRELRWIETNLAPGGSSKLIARASSNDSLLDAIFYFLLMDPKAPAGGDPRPSYPRTHFSEGLGRFLGRTDWTANATWFTYKLGWTTLDHQHADGNMFELYRKGEWLTKERTGYGDDIACTDQKNGVALENQRIDARKKGYLVAEAKRGSQWTYVNDGDGKILASSIRPEFTYFLGDATAAYNASSLGANDIVHSSRSIVWLTPDRVVIYDRAVSKTAGRFKRFFMQLPNSAHLEDGLMDMRTSGGQHLFVRTLLPSPANAVIEAVEPLNDDRGRQPATLDPIRFRLRVEAPGSPKSVRWLHVIQGADKDEKADSPRLLRSSSGTPFEGTSNHDIVILFPVDIGIAVDTFSYAVPVATKAHIITGLAPNGGYNVTRIPDKDMVNVTVKKGGADNADSGGVLVIGKVAQ
jgi:hypothetical protein